MDERIQGITSDMSEIAADAKAAFGSLSAEQLNWKPSADSWSIGQCFDHLIFANSGMLTKLEPVIQGNHRPTFFERLPLLPKLFGKLVLNAVGPKTRRKTKNPGIFDPAQSDVALDMIEKFLRDQENIINVMQTTENIDPERTVMTSPVAVFITYTVLDAFRIITAHEKRHVRQAKRVMEMKGFPA